MAHIKPEYRSGSMGQATAHLAEELAEATQAAAKALRFGLWSVNPELPPSEQESNFLWLRREMRDVSRAYRALSALVVEAGILTPGEMELDLGTEP